MNIKTPLLGIVAAQSNTGKTTLLKRVIPLLKQRGLRLGVVKHTHHHFEIDHPGKDSYELRHAGADQMLIASRKRWALITEEDVDRDDPDILALVANMDQSLDLILLEGLKQAGIAKIEVHRSDVNPRYLAESDAEIIAAVTDEAKCPVKNITVLDINAPEQVAEFICQWVAQQVEAC